MHTERLTGIRIPTELVKRAQGSWNALRTVPMVRAVSPSETGAGAIRTLLFLAMEHLPALLAAAGSDQASAALLAPAAAPVAEPEADAPAAEASAEVPA